MRAGRTAVLPHVRLPEAWAARLRPSVVVLWRPVRSALRNASSRGAGDARSAKQVLDGYVDVFRKARRGNASSLYADYVEGARAHNAAFGLSTASPRQPIEPKIRGARVVRLNR